MGGEAQSIEILGVPFAPLTPEGAVARAGELYERDEPGWIAIENVHAVNLANADPAHAEVLRRADLVLNDGKGMLLGARLLGKRFPADLNGNFFSPLLLDKASADGWPVFFLGAGPGVAATAAERLERSHPGLKVVGVRDGFFTRAQDVEVAAEIRATGAGLLVIGMGMPLQEQWLDRNLAATGARLGSTAGAFFDFQAGVVARAPGWMNRLGIEWVHRLIKEPRRMWRRYILGNPLFVARVIVQRFRARGDTEKVR